MTPDPWNPRSSRDYKAWPADIWIYVSSQPSWGHVRIDWFEILLRCCCRNILLVKVEMFWPSPSKTANREMRDHFRLLVPQQANYRFTESWSFHHHDNHDRLDRHDHDSCPSTSLRSKWASGRILDNLWLGWKDDARLYPVKKKIRELEKLAKICWTW